MGCTLSPQQASSAAGQLLQAAAARPTLVFAADAQHVHDLVAAFRKHGVMAKGILGSTKMREREKVMEQFAKGTLPVLVNCMVVTEGVDVPRVDCIVLARPTRSGVLLQQMLGRGMRRFEGQSHLFGCP